MVLIDRASRELSNGRHIVNIHFLDFTSHFGIADGFVAPFLTKTICRQK